MQTSNEVVGGIHLLQVGQLLDALQILQFVVLQVDGLQHRQLSDVHRQLHHAHVGKVEMALVAPLSMPNFKFDVVEHFIIYY